LHPFGSGPFGEVPSEFYERAAKLIAGFEPEDELIGELAKRAADSLMTMTRLDALRRSATRTRFGSWRFRHPAL